MNDIKVGEDVDIEIKGARVDDILNDGGISFRLVNGDYLWLTPAEGVTITRRAPQPQAGEVWELGCASVVHVLDEQRDGQVVTVGRFRHGGSRLIEDFDFSGATRLYPYRVAIGGGMVIGAEAVQ